jgi:hypothetical protein
MHVLSPQHWLSPSLALHSPNPLLQHMPLEQSALPQQSRGSEHVFFPLGRQQVSNFMSGSITFDVAALLSAALPQTKSPQHELGFDSLHPTSPMFERQQVFIAHLIS